MSGWALHIHIIAATAWIGGSIFMFVLGVTLRDKKAQEEVYPHIGPIFGWFEVAALIALLLSGYIMAVDYALFYVLFQFDDNELTYTILKKVILVGILTIATIIHFVIAYRTNGKERTRIEQLVSRGSSMLIFFLNLFVMHFGIVLRDTL